MLFIFDVYTPTHGVLTVGGVIAFLVGSLMSIAPIHSFVCHSASLFPLMLVTATFFIFVDWKGPASSTVAGEGGKERVIAVTALTSIDSRTPQNLRRRRIWERGEQYSDRER